MSLRGILETDITDDFESSVATETWLCDWDDVYPNYTLNYPALGISHEHMNYLICSQIKVSKEPMWLGGVQVAKLTATFKADYKFREDVFSIKISSGGYQTHMIQAGGAWTGLDGMKGSSEQSVLEYKIPITNLSLSTKIFGEIDYCVYENQVGCLNNDYFYGRNPGTVLFDSYSITPKFVNGEISETELNLNFKISSIDWNYEYRNPVQFVNSYDGRPAFWQNKYPGRFDFTLDLTKVGQPVWSGEIANCGDPRLGVGAWDYRSFEMIIWNNSTGNWETITRCVYPYSDFNILVN